MNPANNRFSVLPLAGPNPWDMVRALPAIRRSPLPFLAQCADRFGDLVAFPVPRMPALLVNDPGAVSQVLIKNAQAYSKATIQYGALSLVTGTGLLTADDPPWRERRAVVQPGFRHEAMPGFAAASADAARILREQWAQAPGAVLDAEAAVMSAMLTVVGRTLFRDDLADVGQQVVHAVDEALRLVIARAQSPLPPALSRRSAARLAKARGVLDDAAAQVIARRRALGDLATADDVLGLLLHACELGVLDPGAVRDELLTMVIAGHETVASALTWALHLLATHPEQQEVLAAELEQVLGPPGSPRTPTWDDLAALPFTQAVLDETLRLYPPAWVITRRSTQPDQLGAVPIPPGTLVIISPWLMHRRSDVFEDPERFDPSRFVASDTASARSLRRPTGHYLPFGVGPRLCIGREVALVEGVLVLAGLMHGQRLVPVRERVDAEALVTLRARGGLPLRLVPR